MAINCLKGGVTGLGLFGTFQILNFFWIALTTPNESYSLKAHQLIETLGTNQKGFLLEIWVLLSIVGFLIGCSQALLRQFYGDQNRSYLSHLFWTSFLTFILFLGRFCSAPASEPPADPSRSAAGAGNRRAHRSLLERTQPR